MTYQIRSFSLSDDLALCAEAEQAAYFEVHSPANLEENTIRTALDRIAKRVQAGTYWGFTAIEEGVPVGLVLIDGEGPAAFIDNLYVVPGSRRRGIGKRLVLQALERLQQEQVGSIELMVTAENEEAFHL